MFSKLISRLILTILVVFSLIYLLFSLEILTLPNIPFSLPSFLNMPFQMPSQLSTHSSVKQMVSSLSPEQIAQLYLCEKEKVQTFAPLFREISFKLDGLEERLRLFSKHMEQISPNGHTPQDHQATIQKETTTPQDQSTSSFFIAASIVFSCLLLGVVVYQYWKHSQPQEDATYETTQYLRNQSDLIHGGIQENLSSHQMTQEMALDIHRHTNQQIIQSQHLLQEYFQVVAQSFQSVASTLYTHQEHFSTFTNVQRALLKTLSSQETHQTLDQLESLNERTQSISLFIRAIVHAMELDPSLYCPHEMMEEHSNTSDEAHPSSNTSSLTRSSTREPSHAHASSDSSHEETST